MLTIICSTRCGHGRGGIQLTWAAALAACGIDQPNLQPLKGSPPPWRFCTECRVARKGCSAESLKASRGFATHLAPARPDGLKSYLHGPPIIVLPSGVVTCESASGPPCPQPQPQQNQSHGRFAGFADFATRRARYSCLAARSCKSISLQRHGCRCQADEAPKARVSASSCPAKYSATGSTRSFSCAQQASTRCACCFSSGVR